MNGPPTTAAPGPSRNGQTNSPGPPARKPLIPIWVWWILLAATVFWNVYELFIPKTPPGVGISYYSGFLSQVRAGVVASFTISGQDVDGEFKQPVTWPPQSQQRQGQQQASQGRQYSRFTTVLPRMDDQRLLPLLDQQGVSVASKNVGGGSWLLDVTVNVLPMLLFVGLLFMMGRSTQRSQQSLFGFGASRARVYSSERHGVTFADVAGADKAKGLDLP